MKPNPTRSALLVIDMENGFVHPEGGHWIRFAQSMVPNCVRAVELARAKGIPVFFVKRLYRADGSDVELTRYPGWVAGGRACRPASTGPNSAQAPEGLRPQPGDYTIIKPRWSAFFQTELDLILRRLDVRTVILTGTTTPNCIRTTCYDAIALEYNTVVLTDCCSSHTEEIQRVNLEDMARAGAILMDSASFADYGPGTVEDLSAAIRARMDDLMARRKASQPLEWPSAGSTFKRPEGYFAGTLIDQTGLKGLTVGGAQVSEKHAGFVINTGSATCADVQELIRRVQEAVYRAHGVRLEPEVRFVGE